VVDLAVMLADGGEAISDLAVLRDQAQLFGPVASGLTAWRLLSDLDSGVLGRLRAARAQHGNWPGHSGSRPAAACRRPVGCNLTVTAVTRHDFGPAG
jgi:hypothetical protein